MQRYAKIINNETKLVSVGSGTDSQFYESQDMTVMDVEQAYNGVWYIAGYAPQKPDVTYQEQRAAEYPPIEEQLDMIYWDKVKGTNLWQEKIKEIKDKYPKVNLND